MLVRGSKGPESNRTSTKLGKPAFQLALGGVVWETTHVKDLATFGEERSNVGTSVHRAGEHVGVLVSWLGFSDQTAENSSKRDGLFHGPSRRGRSESLQMKGQIVLDRSRCLYGFHLKCGTDVGES